MEERLDKVMFERGLVTSRTRGEELIKGGDVLVNGKTIDKPGKRIDPNATIVLLNTEMSWVSRGSLKLLKALDVFEIDPMEKSCLDIGASTGGFTEVLLSKGAANVFCVDVGHGQLHERIRSNPRVVNIEKTHIRELTVNQVPQEIDLCVIDVSFISLEKVIPFAQSFVKVGGQVIALIKPQFELEKKALNKHGVVRSSSFYPGVLKNIENLFKLSNLEIHSIIESPVVGGDGNKEFLISSKKRS